MGHYDEFYAEEEAKLAASRKKARDAARELIKKAIHNACPAHEEFYQMKLKEALYWLDNR